MIYDTAIIGGGVSGAATAWWLSRYETNTVLLEKNADVGFGVSKANSGIVHGGFHHPVSSLKAQLELRGNLMFEQLRHELGFPFERNGILVAAFSEEEMTTVRKLYEQGIANGVHDLDMCGRERMLELEPKLNPDVVGGFFVPGGGTVEPYCYVFSLMESAIGNGVELRCGFEVVSGSCQDGLWTLQSADGREIQARYVVNAAGLYADQVSARCGAEKFTIIPRKGEEYLLDRTCAGRPSRVIFPVPSKHSKGVLVIPTAGGTTMIGPTAEIVEEKDDNATTAGNQKRILSLVRNMINGISERDCITAFAGLRPVLAESEDFYIAPSEKVPCFIQVAGIQSPGLTASPAIGEYVKYLLKKSGLSLAEKAQIKYFLPARHTAREATLEQLDKLHAENPAWAHIVCRCEKISEAEVIAAVRRGHTTVDGVKFYTRAGMGRCQGGFCSTGILQIISRESGIPMTELTKRGPGSTLLAGKLGDLEVKA